MRVISGSARGVSLLARDGLETRPTADRMKESLFNMLSSDIRDCIFLDLFSGSGAIGIEALSRGASLAVFVDESRASTDIISKNLIKTKLTDRSIIIRKPVSDALKQLRAEGRLFDIVFMDPPYNKGYVEMTLSGISEGHFLSESGYIIAELMAGESLAQVAGFQVFKEKRYRTTTFMFFEQLM